MKTLPESFEKKGFRHSLVVRKGDVAIYKRQKREIAPHWEVVKIKRHNGYALAGVHIEPAETYPSSEEWGTKGWTYNTADEAFAKFAKLIGTEQ